MTRRKWRVADCFAVLALSVHPAAAEHKPKRIEEGVAIGAGGSRDAAERGRCLTKRQISW